MTGILWEEMAVEQTASPSQASHARGFCESLHAVKPAAEMDSEERMKHVMTAGSKQEMAAPWVAKSKRAGAVSPLRLVRQEVLANRSAVMNEASVMSAVMMGTSRLGMAAAWTVSQRLGGSAPLKMRDQTAQRAAVIRC